MNIIKTVDEYTGILAVPAYDERDEYGDTKDREKEYHFMAIYVDRRFLDTLRFIKKFTETADTDDNGLVEIGEIKFYPKKETFPVLLFEGKLDYNKYPFSFSGFKPKNISDPTLMKNGFLHWKNSNSISDSMWIVSDSRYLHFTYTDFGVVYKSFDINLDYLISYTEENLKDGD